MDGNVYAKMSSRGPIYSPKAKSNCILARRAARNTQGMNLDAYKPLINRHIPEELPDGWFPSNRQALRWEKSQPNFPETMLSQGVLTEADIIPAFRPYVNLYKQ